MPVFWGEENMHVLQGERKICPSYKGRETCARPLRGIKMCTYFGGRNDVPVHWGNKNVPILWGGEGKMCPSWEEKKCARLAEMSCKRFF